jgi:hypothetical protein
MALEVVKEPWPIERQTIGSEILHRKREAVVDADVAVEGGNVDTAHVFEDDVFGAVAATLLLGPFVSLSRSDQAILLMIKLYHPRNAGSQNLSRRLHGQ